MPKARWFKHVQGNEVLWPIQVCCLFDRKPLKSCRIRDCTFGYEHGNKASGVGFQTTSLPGITPWFVSQRYPTKPSTSAIESQERIASSLRSGLTALVLAIGASLAAQLCVPKALVLMGPVSVQTNNEEANDNTWELIFLLILGLLFGLWLISWRGRSRNQRATRSIVTSLYFYVRFDHYGPACSHHVSETATTTTTTSSITTTVTTTTTLLLLRLLLCSCCWCCYYSEYCYDYYYWDQIHDNDNAVALAATATLLPLLSLCYYRYSY